MIRKFFEPRLPAGRLEYLVGGCAAFVTPPVIFGLARFVEITLTKGKGEPVLSVIVATVSLLACVVSYNILMLRRLRDLRCSAWHLAGLWISVAVVAICIEALANPYLFSELIRGLTSIIMIVTGFYSVALQFFMLVQAGDIDKQEEQCKAATELARVN